MSAPQKTIKQELHDANELIRKRNAENTQLRRDVDRLQREHDLQDEIRTKIFGLAAHTPKPPKWLSGHGGKPGSRGAPATMWSDWHWGEVVQAAEVGGVNEFNRDTASYRAKRLVNTTIDLAFNHMGRAKAQYPGIVIALGGDMLGGDIHEELMVTNECTAMETINEVTDVLAGCLAHMADQFKNVFVPCVVGNHGRTTRKPRLKQHVTTNLDWVIYCNLEREFRRDKRITFMVPRETDARFDVFGHRYLLTHGDNLGVKGGDGIIGALGPIMRGSLKTGRSEAQIGRAYDTLLIGHWHQYLTLPGLIVNNSFKGYDEFARLVLRAPYSRPSQALWFTHPQHGITAHWQVYLEPLRQANETVEWVTWPKAKTNGS